MVNFRAWKYVILLLLALPFILAATAVVIAIQKRGSANAGAGTSAPSAGCYPDPNDATLLRYWDGTQWTGRLRRVSQGMGRRQEKTHALSLQGVTERAPCISHWSRST